MNINKSLSIRVPRGFQIVLILGFLTLGANDAMGWGVFKKVFQAAKSALSFAGSIPGSFIGGFVGAATAPAVSQIEQSGKNVIAEANQALEARLNQMDDIMKNRLGQMDSILKNRIDQVDITLSNRISQVDTVLAVRIEQLDSILDQRLAQLDEMTEKRIGNLDVVATKASLAFEESIIRAFAVGCLMVFVSFAIWLAYKEGVTIWPAIARKPLRMNLKLTEFFREVWPKIAGRLALASAAVLVLLLGFSFLPGGAKGRRNQLADTHLKALERHLGSFNFREVAYHSSQLKALDATDSRLTGARLKSELLRDLFFKPSAIQSREGFLDVTERIVEIENCLGKEKDPDVQTIKGIILWRTAGNKLFEHYAASCFAMAVEKGHKRGFALEPLAISYLDVYLDSPLSNWVMDEMPGRITETNKVMAAEGRELFGSSITKYPVAKMESLVNDWKQEHAIFSNDRDAIQSVVQNALDTPRPLRPFLAYNALVKELRRKSGTNYTDMLVAYAIGTSAAPKMVASANAVLSSWNTFNEGVGSEVFSSAPNIRIAPLLLNDAVQGRAALYAGATIADSVPAATQTDTSKLTRVKIQPRLNAFLGTAPLAQKLVNWQETQRYCVYEKDTQDFEVKFVAFRKAKAQQVPTTTLFEKAFDAAAAAAKIGLYDYRDAHPHSLAESILKEAGVPDTEMRQSYAQQFETVRSALQQRTPGVL